MIQPLIRAGGMIYYVQSQTNNPRRVGFSRSKQRLRSVNPRGDITERKEQEEHLRFLMKEVNHRSKKLLGLVQAVAQQTAKTSPNDFVTRFGERVQALAGAQDLLIKSQWKAVSLNVLIHSQIAHFHDLIGDRIQVQGPDIKVLPAAAQTIGMAVHELATNAGKYGALSNQVGRVEVSWDMRAGQSGDPQFVMSWMERGGPPVTKPTRRGFGSTVIGVMVNIRLYCDAEIDYAPTGFRWRIACPAAKIIENAEAATMQGSVTTPGTGSKRVLVVEDEALIAMDIAATLSDAGSTVIGPAGSVAQALALIEHLGCEAAVLDINLGDETSEAIARVLTARATPFVTISDYSREQQPAASRNAPLVNKPVRPELRFARKQQMQWTRRGAHLLLQTRTRTLDGTLRSTFERRDPGLINNQHPTSFSRLHKCSTLPHGLQVRGVCLGGERLYGVRVGNSIQRNPDGRLAA